jgi:sulfatase maturation enzyme AslB (radical SAM superfamily)
MISKYLRFRKKDDRIVIFHELHPDPLYCSLQEWEQFVCGQEDASLESGLKERGLIVNSQEEDQKAYECACEKLLKKHSQAGTLYLMTAQGCNLGCKYCFVPDLARKYGEAMLRESDAIAGIDLWFEHLKDTYDPNTPYFVIFYGGEPLLNL